MWIDAEIVKEELSWMEDFKTAEGILWRNEGDKGKGRHIILSIQVPPKDKLSAQIVPNMISSVKIYLYH